MKHEVHTPARGKPAVFLDRDGVLTEPIWNPATGEYESPHTLHDLVYCPDIFAPLRGLMDAGFELFIVSNQPSYAKGKAALEDLQAIARAVEKDCRAHAVLFRDTYYCYHHPHGIVPAYTVPCLCRKPSPFFLLQAATRHELDLRRSWMVGDRDSDVRCGQRAGCRTILITHAHAGAHWGQSQPHYRTHDIAAAGALILAEDIPSRGQ